MKRWHVLVIVLVACSWIGTAVRWKISDNQATAARQKLENRQAYERGDRRNWRIATPQERSAAVVVITSQLQAFKKGDFKTALSLQTAQLRAGFTSPDAFAAMMKANYPDYMSYQSVHFGRGRVPPSGKGISIRVVLTTRNGNEVQSVYHLSPENKKLRIAGVSGGQRDMQQMPQAPAPPII